MTDDADKLDMRLARLLVASRQEEPNEHPAPDELSAYYMNELPPQEADAIQEHLAECTFCADLLLDLESSLEPPVEDQERKGVADLGAEAGWRKVREQMGWRERRQEPAAEVVRLRRAVHGLQALAAALLVAVVGLSVYTVRLHGPREVPPMMAERTLDFARTRSREPLKEVEVTLPISLKLFVEEEYSRYKIEIRTADGRRLSSQIADSERLTLPLLEGSLPPGTYTLHLSGIQDGQSEPISSPVKLMIRP